MGEGVGRVGGWGGDRQNSALLLNPGHSLGRKEALPSQPQPLHKVFVVEDLLDSMKLQMQNNISSI